MNERRKFKRYDVPEGKVFIFNHFSTKVGFIKNLSRGGLLFEYIHLVEEVIDPEVVDLFSYDFNKFFLTGLPCEMIFVSKASSEGNGPKTKRCGLKFQDLDEKQKAQLHSLLNNFVAPIV
ncbi:MAG: PilZ domain-containing protein [Desulfobacterales bacterium]|nr:PilZ domain-containing protein [Desulfobacterales bacterium]